VVIVLAALAALALLFVVQPFVLQFACATTGVKPPGLGKAFGIALAAFVVGTLASGVWAFTGGLLFSMVHTGLGVLSGFAFSALVAAIVYSATLRVSVNRGARVALVVHVVGFVLTAIVSAALWTTAVATGALGCF